MSNVAKFDLKDLLPIGFTVVILGIGLAYGLEVMGDVRDDIGAEQCAKNVNLTTYDTSTQLCTNGSLTEAVGTADFNATNSGISGVAKIPNKLPTIMTVVVAAVIIGILLRYLYVRTR